MLSSEITGLTQHIDQTSERIPTFVKLRTTFGGQLAPPCRNRLLSRPSFAFALRVLNGLGSTPELDEEQYGPCTDRSPRTSLRSECTLLCLEVTNEHDLVDPNDTRGFCVSNWVCDSCSASPSRCIPWHCPSCPWGMDMRPLWVPNSGTEGE
jgi:hypothetical protein